MRRFLILTALLLVGLGDATAEDEAAKPLTPEQAADAVLAAFEAGDRKTLGVLAEKAAPDPWLVVDELCSSGRIEAADAFAVAAPRKDTDHLPAYVASQRGREPETTGRETLRAMKQALGTGHPQAALEAAEALKGTAGDLDTVVRIRIQHGRGLALRMLRRLEESAEAFHVAAKAAETLGWLAIGAALLHESGVSALHRSDYRTALSRWQERLALEEARHDRASAARALGNIGILHYRLGNHPEAISFYERSLAKMEELGDRAGMAATLGNLGLISQSLGDYAKALSCHERALTMMEEMGNRAGVATTLGNIGNIHYHLGDYPEALSCQKRALAMKEEMGDRAGVATTLGNLGSVLQSLGDYPEALSYMERSLGLSEKLGDRAGVATALGNIGIVHYRLSDYPKALSYHERALAMKEQIGDRAGVAATLGSIGSVHQSLGDYAEALSYQERALAMMEKLGDRAGVATTLGNIGNIHCRLGDYPEALSHHERALTMKEKIGDRAGVAATLGSIGSVRQSLCDYAKALSYQERALAMMEELGDRAGAAMMLRNIGIIHCRLGDYPEALSHHERALEVSEELDDRAGVARTLGSIGNVHRSLGDYPDALSYHERALRLSEELGDRVGVTRTLGNIGNIHLSLGNYPEALTHCERALAMMEELGDRAGVATTLGNIGIARECLGDYPEALSLYERSLAMREELGDRAGVALTRGNIGLIHAHLGDYPKAVRHLDRAVREARRVRARETLVRHLGNLARVRLSRGEAARALMAARQALTALESLIGGLAEEESATARAQHADVFAVGTLAAVRLEEPAEMVAFLESGRAGALLETLGGRKALRWTDLPDDLRKAEAEAKTVESRARWEYGRALDKGAFRDIRKKAKALDEARERVREVSARIQRDAKRQAELFYPQAATLEEIQSWLGQETVLVLYGLCLDEALALVLTSDAERIVSLGRAAEVEAACEALRLEESEAETAEALDRLRALLVDPLEIPGSVETVLVSPEGPLCYLPLGALFEEQAVAVTPSGTTHVLLLEEESATGEKVLALGDPDYGLDPDPGAVAIYRGGMNLVRLPGTREEATAVGDVVLLGAEANEEKLRETLEQHKRWRALHLACHGLVDPERPTLSSLALTRSGGEDGFLTALEVLRMEIPADLVVLSACETGKGKIVKGEGIVGLTRVFMYAGSPRVICSLWKVDDEATRALMTRFYELWNPRQLPGTLSERSEAPLSERQRVEGSNGDGSEGLGAAEALKKAQAFVRSHPKWKHPHYWAAWVLWGLPE